MLSGESETVHHDEVHHMHCLSKTGNALTFVSIIADPSTCHVFLSHLLSTAHAALSQPPLCHLKACIKDAEPGCGLWASETWS